jgi:non-heme chloroperoxidase
MGQLIKLLRITAPIILLLFTCLSAWSQENGEPQKPILVAGAGGTKSAVYEYGDPNGAEILLVHGFSQSHLSWAKQYKSPVMQKFRIVVIDLRGHGASDKPANPESYNNGKVWADDINAVIKAKSLKRPVIVGMSYGGFIISDYVREYGDSNLGGIVFVGAATQLGTEDAKTHYGPGMKPIAVMLDPRLEINIPSTIEFLRTLTVDALPAQEFQEALAYNMAVSTDVRLALLSRQIDSNDALAKVKVPVLIVQGERDQIVLPAAADYIASKVKHAKKSYYPNVGHAPFLEDPERLNREIAEMAKK